MSTTETLTTSGLTDLVKSATDGKPDDIGALDSAIHTLGETIKRAVSEARRAYNAAKSLAEANVGVRRHILLPNGHPDWAAKSDLYRLVVADNSSLWEGTSADEKRRVMAAARQHVGRGGVLRTAMEAYVRETVNGMTDEPKDSAKFLAALKREYESAGKDAKGNPVLTVPADVSGKTPEGNASMSPTDGETERTPLDTMRDAAKGIATVVPLNAAQAILFGVSKLSERMTAKDAKVTDRPKVVAVLHRVATVATLTAKHLDGKASDDDGKALSDALWSADDDA